MSNISFFFGFIFYSIFEHFNQISFIFNFFSGVFWPIDSYTADVYVDITGVVELTTSKQFDDCLTLGANMNLTDTMNLFRKVAKLNSKFAYLDKMATHIDMVAHVPVRNVIVYIICMYNYQKYTIIILDWFASWKFNDETQTQRISF